MWLDVQLDGDDGRRCEGTEMLAQAWSDGKQTNAKDVCPYINLIDSVGTMGSFKRRLDMFMGENDRWN